MRRQHCSTFCNCFLQHSLNNVTSQHGTLNHTMLGTKGRNFLFINFSWNVFEWYLSQEIKPLGWGLYTVHHFSWVSYKKPHSACQNSVVNVIKLLRGLLCSNVEYKPTVINCFSIYSSSQLCLVWNILLIVRKNMLERRNVGNEEHPHLSIPGTGLHSTAKNFIWLFLPAVLWGRKKLNSKLQEWASPAHPQSQSTHPKYRVQQYWKMSHAITAGRYNQMTLLALISPHQHITRAGFPAIYGSCYFCWAQSQSYLLVVITHL